MERVFDSNPELKYSIQEAQNELKNPVKNFDKLKTLYDKVKKAEDDKKREAMIDSSRASHHASMRSFMDDTRSPMPFSHIPKEFMYHKPYSVENLYRTPVKTRDDDDDDDDEVYEDPETQLLQSRNEKKPKSRLFMEPPPSTMHSFAPTIYEPYPTTVRHFDFTITDADGK